MLVQRRPSGVAEEQAHRRMRLVLDHKPNQWNGLLPSESPGLPKPVLVVGRREAAFVLVSVLPVLHHRDHAGLQQFPAVEEPGDLVVRPRCEGQALGAANDGDLVHLVGVEVRTEVADHQIAAAG